MFSICYNITSNLDKIKKDLQRIFKVKPWIMWEIFTV